MSLRTHKWRFIRSLVEDAPDTRGVYVLWEDDKLICIGRADGNGPGIRSHLLAHLDGTTGSEARHATHYSWEICSDPVTREGEVLRELRTLFSRANKQGQVIQLQDQKRSA